MSTITGTAAARPDATMIEPTGSRAAVLRLLAWLSPAFPVGSFSYSHGLERAVLDGAVADEADLREWIESVAAPRLGLERCGAFGGKLAAHPCGRRPRRTRQPCRSACRLARAAHGIAVARHGIPEGGGKLAGRCDREAAAGLRLLRRRRRACRGAWRARLPTRSAPSFRRLPPTCFRRASGSALSDSESAVAVSGALEPVVLDVSELRGMLVA